MQDLSEGKNQYIVAKEDAVNENKYIILGRFENLEAANNYIISLCR